VRIPLWCLRAMLTDAMMITQTSSVIVVVITPHNNGNERWRKDGTNAGTNGVKGNKRETRATTGTI
jgi:hypothetical protein